MKYLGGYSILDLTDANVSAQANVCYNQDKPVLVYGANGERYFADTITKSGTSFIVTKGGKTITIANDNTITNVGDIQPHLYEYQFSLSDYYFNVLLPIKIDDRTLPESNDDLTDEDKAYINNLYKYLSSMIMSGYSVDSAYDNQMSSIAKNTTNLSFYVNLVAYSDGSDTSDQYSLNFANGEVEDIATADYELDIKFIRQLF